MKIRQLEIAVIGDEDLVSSLRLAGVSRYRVVEEDDREEVRRALTEFLGEPDIGIIVVLEDYMTKYLEMEKPTNHTFDQ